MILRYVRMYDKYACVHVYVGNTYITRMQPI